MLLQRSRYHNNKKNEGKKKKKKDVNILFEISNFHVWAYLKTIKINIRVFGAWSLHLVHV
jgi:hypothetical protein